MTDTANAPEREAGTPGPHEPDYKTAMLYHSDRADAYMGERDALTAELAKLRADLAEAQAKIARLTNALEEIADRHIPDQPAALDISEAEYVRRQHTELRRTARATLAEVRRFAGAALQENANE